MSKIYLKLMPSIASLFLLMSCATTPTYININPTLSLASDTYAFHNQQAWEVKSQDLRIARHLIEIVNGDNVAELINEQQSLRLIIEKNLTQAWLENGLNVDKISEQKLDIQLMKSLATVTEATLSYNVKSQMIVKIQLKSKDKTFVRLFRSNHQWEAPFSISTSSINDELNIQLSQLLNQIIQDQALNAKLQQF